MNEIEVTDWQITEAMIKYGGGFVQRLGELYRHGDIENRFKLKTAFENYWFQYAELVRMNRDERK